MGTLTINFWLLRLGSLFHVHAGILYLKGLDLHSTTSTGPCLIDAPALGQDTHVYPDI